MYDDINKLVDTYNDGFSRSSKLKKILHESVLYSELLLGERNKLLLPARFDLDQEQYKIDIIFGGHWSDIAYCLENRRLENVFNDFSTKFLNSFFHAQHLMVTELDKKLREESPLSKESFEDIYKVKKVLNNTRGEGVVSRNFFVMDIKTFNVEKFILCNCFVSKVPITTRKSKKVEYLTAREIDFSNEPRGHVQFILNYLDYSYIYTSEHNESLFNLLMIKQEGEAAENVKKDYHDIYNSIFKENQGMVELLNKKSSYSEKILKEILSIMRFYSYID